MDARALPQGTELDGSYKIESVLGSGSTSITYLALDHKLGRKCAIKEYFPPGLAVRGDQGEVHPAEATFAGAYSEGLGHFSKDARALGVLAHQNLVALFRTFTANGTAYKVLEYIDGQDLDSALRAFSSPLLRLLRR